MSGEIARQSLWASVINYTGSLIGLFTTFYLFPLVYTESQNGIIRLFIEMGALLAAVAQLGTGYSIWKFFPVFKDTSKKHNGVGFWLFAIPIIGVLLVSVCLLVFQPWVIKYLGKNSAEFLPYYLWLLPFIFFFVFNSVFEIFSASLGNILYSSFLRENVVRILLGLIGLLFYCQTIGFSTAVYLVPAVYGITAIFNFYFVNKSTSLSYKPDMQFINEQPGLKKDFYRYTGYLFLTYLANLVVQRLDFVMVSSMKGLISTGVYSIAVNLAILIEIPTRSILQISNPKLSEAMHRNDNVEMKRLYEKTTLNQFIIGSLVLLAIWINIDVFYYLMPNGEKYAPGKLAVLILGIGKLFILLQGNSTAILTFSKKYYFTLIINLFTVAAGIILNQMLIPKFGLNGAAAATAFVWLIGGIVIGIIVYAIYKINPYNWNIVKAIAIVVTGFALNHFIQIPNHFILTAVVKFVLIMGGILILIYKLKVSEDINSMVDKVGKRVGIR